MRLRERFAADGRRGLAFGNAHRRCWRRNLPTALVLLVVSALVCAPSPSDAVPEPAARAVWRVANEKGTNAGTAFAIGERHFLTNAHVVESFADADSKRIVLTQRGSEAALTVNYDHAALSLTYDLAVFTTGESVRHVLELAPRATRVRGTGHRIVGYPKGRFRVAAQIGSTTHEDALSLRLPVDHTFEGGFSGSPLLDRDDRVVGVVHSGSGSTAAVVKLEHVHDFLDGKVQWTACRDYASPKGCLAAAMRATEHEAQAGDVLAQVELGDRHRKRGDWDRAIRWYRRAAEHGNAFAMYRLAHIHYHGRGVAKDERLAFEWMLRSARAGFTDAQYNVGVYYLWGLGTAVDRARGRDWLENAAAKGDEDARKLLAETRSGQGSRPDSTAGPGRVMWATKRSNVREGPGTGYAKVGLLEVGESVHVIDRTGDWFRLQPRPGQPDRFVYGALLTESARATSTQ